MSNLSATDATSLTWALVDSGDARSSGNQHFRIDNGWLRTDTALAAGTYNIYISATDQAWNVSYLADTFTVTDTTPPTGYIGNAFVPAGIDIPDARSSEVGTIYRSKDGSVFTDQASFCLLYTSRCV